MAINKNLILLLMLAFLVSCISIEKFIAYNKAQAYNYTIPRRPLKIKPIPGSMEIKPMGRLFDDPKQWLIGHEPQKECECNTTIYNNSKSTSCACYLHR